ncbi:TetR/AcrR family transcriptional regulator [Agromyces protaetiae]|uniref:TetR/AcrR family transcriptional regulator n=1 Tax=Agromyces protaetiae TaxID=2509455 RepID=A0A4P6FE35_9MICO|nr:TetR/AcrR family transcriptional regulator [Agromyces protaetiae]QAY74165.1 TetR/AcrR family transcriptional regulator [Agromyces protaetiae]
MPNIDLIHGSEHAKKRTVRTEPTQRRSTQRLDALLDAAAEIVDEIGFERLTTQMVAERAGASIGTVYRYFPDRVAVLQGLRERSIDRYRAQVAARIAERTPSGWWEVIEGAIEVSASMYRSEPGFDVVHAAPRDLSDDGDSEFATRIARMLAAEFPEVEDTPELRFRLGIVIEIADSLIYRASTRSTEVSRRYVEAAKSLVREYLSDLLEPAFQASEAA